MLAKDGKMIKLLKYSIAKSMDKNMSEKVKSNKEGNYETSFKNRN